MKIDKNSARAARQLFRACVDANGRLHGSRIKAVITKLAQTKPRGYLAILSAFERLVRLEVQKRHSWGAKKLRSVLRRREPGVAWPSVPTSWLIASAMACTAIHG